MSLEPKLKVGGTPLVGEGKRSFPVRLDGAEWPPLFVSRIQLRLSFLHKFATPQGKLCLL